jgi:hypothetical protein
MESEDVNGRRAGNAKIPHMESEDGNGRRAGNANKKQRPKRK